MMFVVNKHLMQQLYPQFAVSQEEVAAGTHLRKTSPCFMFFYFGDLAGFEVLYAGYLPFSTG